MADPRDYLASPLGYSREGVSIEEPEALDPITEAWMVEQGMNEFDKANMRAEYKRHKGVEAQRRETQAPHQLMSTPPSEREVPAFRGMGMSQYVPPEQVVETAEAYVSPVPPLEAAISRAEAMTPPPPQALPAPKEEAELAGAPPSGSRIGYRDGVFTNIGVGEEEAGAYRGGVADFRERMRAHQAGLGPPPEGTRETPGGHMLGDPDAPLPGDKNYPEGGFVSGYHMEDPTKALTEEGWRAMTPIAQRTYTEQAAQISGLRQAQAVGTVAEHEAAMTEPDYAAEQRKGFYQSFIDVAKTDPEVVQSVAATMAKFQEMRPDVAEGSPEWDAAAAGARRTAISAWLKREHGDYAPWDDVLSRNLGLTFS